MIAATRLSRNSCSYTTVATCHCGLLTVASCDHTSFLLLGYFYYGENNMSLRGRWYENIPEGTPHYVTGHARKRRGWGAHLDLSPSRGQPLLHAAAACQYPIALRDTMIVHEGASVASPSRLDPPKKLGWLYSVHVVRTQAACVHLSIPYSVDC